MTLPEVTDILRRLVARDIVRVIAGQPPPPRYEYKIELVRLWVDRYKALGRVFKEVGLMRYSKYLWLFRAVQF